MRRRLSKALQSRHFAARCLSLRLRRQLKNSLTTPVQHRYVFILCPPYCASTLLHELLCTSPFVSPNNIFGTRGGFALPEIQKLVDFRQRWNENYRFPWADIRDVWSRYWDHTKPLLVDKSPPHLFQAGEVIQHFRPASFVAMVRNPYVHCEALMRRDRMTAREAARRSFQCLSYQKKNLSALEDVLLIRYEDLAENPARIREQLMQFLPSLRSLDIGRKFKSHYKGKSFRIRNMNVGKIERIGSKDIRAINGVLEPHADLLRYFGYDLEASR